MLASANRLKRGGEISRAMARGRYASEGVVVVRALRSRQPHSRGVVVVGKKASKKAVVRNRLRRQLAATLAGRWATVAPGYDIVITVRSGALEATSAELTKQLDAALRQLNLIS